MQGRGNGGRGHRGARGGGGLAGVVFSMFRDLIYFLPTILTGGRGRGSAEYPGPFPNFMNGPIDPVHLISGYGSALVSDPLNSISRYWMLLSNYQSTHARR
jgi:hypothetical protein